LRKKLIKTKGVIQVLFRKKTCLTFQDRQWRGIPGIVALTTPGLVVGPQAQFKTSVQTVPLGARKNLII
jgi:hypothetical protein